MNVNERNSVSVCTHTYMWAGWDARWECVCGGVYVCRCGGLLVSCAGVVVRQEVVCMCRSVSYATAVSVNMLYTLLDIINCKLCSASCSELHV